MLRTIFTILVLAWLLGFSLGVGGRLIHWLLMVALAVLILNFVSRHRRLA